MYRKRGGRTVRAFVRRFRPRRPASLSHRRHLRSWLQLLPRRLHQRPASSHGGSGWTTDYPDAELNFSIRLAELTKTRVKRDETGTPEFVTVRPHRP